MLKKILVAVLVAFPMIVSAQTIKIGLVDSQAVFTALPETKAAEEKMMEIQKKYEDEYTKLREEMSRKIEEFQALEKDASALPAIKERKMQDLQDYQTKLADFEKMVQQDMQKQQETLMMPIYTKIKSAIESVGKEGAYTIIQETGAVLYYGAPAEDITPKVKAKLGL